MKIDVNYLGGMKFQAKCNEHTVNVDLPTASDGANTAATPPQLFLVSLASCVGVYVAGYCNNVGLNTQGLKISISAEKVPAPDRLDNIKIVIALPGTDVGKRKEAVLAVARKCLIHNTIKNHPVMDIELVSADT